MVDGALAALGPVGAPATRVLSSHDETRHVTRLGRAHSGAAAMGLDVAAPPTSTGGSAGPASAALRTPAPPGGARLHQGEELGLPEVEDLPEEALQDPTWRRCGHTARAWLSPGRAAGAGC